jgi:enamine deaminase RidA (YjgF/YER057c/UK114 family)
MKPASLLRRGSRPATRVTHMAEHDAIFPAGRQELYQKYRYSAAIRSGNLLFVSGQVGSRDDGSPGPDFAKQVQLAFDRLNAVLAAAGASFDDVVEVTTFHTGAERQLETVMALHDQAIGAPPIPTASRWA